MQKIFVFKWSNHVILGIWKHLWDLGTWPWDGPTGRGVGSGHISDGVKNDQNFKCSLEPREHSPKIFWWFLTPFRSNFCLKKNCWYGPKIALFSVVNCPGAKNGVIKNFCCTKKWPRRGKKINFFFFSEKIFERWEKNFGTSGTIFGQNRFWGSGGGVRSTVTSQNKIRITKKLNFSCGKIFQNSFVFCFVPDCIKKLHFH